jgi:hypothetical protein
MCLLHIYIFIVSDMSPFSVVQKVQKVVRFERLPREKGILADHCLFSAVSAHVTSDLTHFNDERAKVTTTLKEIEKRNRTLQNKNISAFFFFHSGPCRAGNMLLNISM